MAKVRIMLKKKDSKQVECPVCLAVSDRGDRAFIVTGFAANTQNFDEVSGRYNEGRGIKAFEVVRVENGKKATYTNKAANAILAEMEQRANELIKAYEKDKVNWSMDIFRNDYLHRPARTLFAEYASQKIKELKADGRYKKAEILGGTLKSLMQYDRTFETKKFQDINYRFLDLYIKAQENNGNSGNTIALRLCEIRKLYNDAIAENLCSAKDYPFGAGNNKICVKGHKEYQTRKDNFLPMNYLAKFAQAELPTMRMTTAQHLFLLSYFAEGVNWRDMAFWTDANISDAETIDPITGDVKSVRIIRYQRSKTGCVITTPISDEIQRELDWFKANTETTGHYLLPIIQKQEDPENTLQHVSDARKRYNITLRNITKLLEFPDKFQDIATYTARHTFAVALQVQGASAKTLQERLHHSEGDTEMQKNYTAETLEITNVFDPTK